MTRRRRPLPPQPCSLTDETGNHDITKMTATHSRGRIAYLCPECGFNVTVPDEGEASEKERPAADPEPKPRREAPEESSKEAPREAPRIDPKPKPRKGGRGVTEAFKDGATIEMEGHTHTLREVTICWPEKPATFYEIYREDGEHMGRVSQAVSWQRTENLIFRAYHPETERYPAGGITWTGRIRALRDPERRKPGKEGQDRKERNPTLYVTIPKATVERFDIRTDDEVSVRVGDRVPESMDEWYHVSEMSGSKIVILSKLNRMEIRENVPSKIPEIGEYVTVHMKAHPGTGRRNLCHWAEAAMIEAEKEGVEIRRPSLGENGSPEAPEPEREEPAAVTVFNDF